MSLSPRQLSRYTAMPAVGAQAATENGLLASLIPEYHPVDRLQNV
jgi:hypothetical protein